MWCAMVGTLRGMACGMVWCGMVCYVVQDVRYDMVCYVGRLKRKLELKRRVRLLVQPSHVMTA